MRNVSLGRGMSGFPSILSKQKTMDEWIQVHSHSTLLDTSVQLLVNRNNKSANHTTKILHLGIYTWDSLSLKLNIKMRGNGFQ